MTKLQHQSLLITILFKYDYLVLLPPNKQYINMVHEKITRI